MQKWRKKQPKTFIPFFQEGKYWPLAYHTATSKMLQGCNLREQIKCASFIFFTLKTYVYPIMVQTLKFNIILLENQEWRWLFEDTAVHNHLWANGTFLLSHVLYCWPQRKNYEKKNYKRKCYGTIHLNFIKETMKTKWNGQLVVT